MNITINAIVSIVGVLLFIASWVKRFKTYRFLFLFMSIISLIVTFGLSFLNNDTRTAFNYVSLSIEENASLLDLKLVDRQLMDAYGNQVTYEYSPYESESDFEPIYLSDVHPDYFLVVYSRDKNEKISEGRFIQRDYELQNETSNRLILLSKKSGLMTVIHSYEIIGFTAMLDDAISSESMISIPICKPYTPTVNYYFTLYIDEQLDTLSVMEAHHAFAGNERNILKYYLSDAYYFALYDNQTIEFTYINVVFEYQTFNDKLQLSSGSVSHRPNPMFDEEPYVIEGYITMKNGYIYYVGSDLSIYKYNGMLEKVADVEVLEQWENQIP